MVGSWGGGTVQSTYCRAARSRPPHPKRRQTNEQGKWAHAGCATWVPELKYVIAKDRTVKRYVGGYADHQPVIDSNRPCDHATARHPQFAIRNLQSTPTQHSPLPIFPSALTNPDQPLPTQPAPPATVSSLGAPSLSVACAERGIASTRFSAGVCYLVVEVVGGTTGCSPS